MPFYHHLGELPHKRHTQFRRPDGLLYHEQVMGTRGFEGIQSIVYHRCAPTAMLQAEDRGPIEIAIFARAGSRRVAISSPAARRCCTTTM